MFGRPYRNVPTEELQRLYNEAVSKVDDLYKRHYSLIARPMEKLIRAYGRELTKRTKEAQHAV